MKKMMLCTAIVVATLTANTATAQVRVNVNVNIGSQPQWGPAGYDYVDYYYLPDIETYYYVPTRQFIYLSGRNWIFSYGLPPAHRHYNLHTGYKVVINQPRAYHYHSTHKVKYAKYKGHKGHGTWKNHPGKGHGRKRGRH